MFVSGTPGQNYNYQVRAVKLETSASGTYLNASQGAFGTGSFSGPVTREIQVTGNDRVIPSGDTIATMEAGTDFGSVEANVQTVSHTFVIANDGTAVLHLTANPPVQISGPAAGDFSVLAQPVGSIAGMGSVSFQVAFAPTVVGARSATVSIASDDADEGAYLFTVSGRGLTPSPEIGLSPSSIAATLATNAMATSPVTISNTGAGVLHHAISTSQTGYSSRDSNSFGGPGYAWIEIRGTGTEVTGYDNPDDSISGPISLGFNFPFFGNTFTSVRVCTNGFITLMPATPLYFNADIPSIEAPGNIIAAFWNDLILDAGSHIYTQRIGDLFVVQFDDIPRFGFSDERVTCEIVLRQNGEVLIQYKQVPAAFTGYTVGVQDGQRSQGVRVAYNMHYAEPQLALRIAPPLIAPWLGASVNSGTVAAISSQQIAATVDGSGLQPGHYFATLNVTSDDADEAHLSVPVQLSVSGPEVDLLGNGLSIASGDMVSAVVDGTDFGMVAIAGGSITRTFTIRNSGSDSLTVSACSVSGAGFAVTAQPVGTIAPSGITTFAITFAPTVAGGSTANVSFTTNDVNEGSYSFAVTGLALAPVESWRLAHFDGIANTGDSADSADPDFDGLRNILEYGFGLDPKVAGLAGIPTVRVNAGGYLEIRFNRNTANSDLTYTVQASANLLTWTGIASSTAGAAMMGSGAHSVQESGAGAISAVTVEDSQPVSAGSVRFLRVKILRN